MRLVEKHAGSASASQKRGQSVSDGVSRASLRVFAVKTHLAVLRRRRLTSHPTRATSH